MFVMKTKYIIAIILAICVTAVFAACAKPDDQKPAPTEAPATVTEAPTEEPTEAPTEVPTEEPTEVPTEEPTEAPTEDPDKTPSPIENMNLNIPYVTDGLVALYEGNYNTANGMDKTSAVWGDLSGNGLDIELKLSDYCEWRDDGLFVSMRRINLPDRIAELINGEAYTVEFAMKDLVITGSNYATFLNSSGNDNFALFIRVSDDALEFKCNNGIGSRPNMVGDAAELCATSTIAVTFEADGQIELYLNGEFIDSRDAASSTDIAGHMFIGHPSEEKSYDATITGIRFYDRVLSEKELASNAKALGTITPKTPAE